MATLYGKPLMSLRVVDLREELDKRGLSKTGAKKDLVERLSNYILENEGQEDIGDVGEEAEAAPPTVNIDTKLEDNDIVREYMMLRETQFKTAVDAKQQSEDSSADESPRKSRRRGAGKEGSSPIKEVKSPIKEVKSPIKEVKSPIKEVKSPIKEVQSRGGKEVDVPLEKDAEVAAESDERVAKSFENAARSPRKEPSSPEKTVKSPAKEAKAPNVEEIETSCEDAKRGAKETASPDKETKAPEEDIGTAKSDEKREGVGEHKMPTREQDAAIEKSRQGLLEETKGITEEGGAQSPAKGKEDTVETIAGTEKKDEPVATASVDAKKEGRREELAEQKEEQVDKEKDDVTTKVEDAKDSPGPDETEDEIVVSESINFDESVDKGKPEASPREPVAFRKLSRLSSKEDSSSSRKKRHWGDSKKSTPVDETIAVSSTELKDIIPDIKPVMEEIKKMEAGEGDATRIEAGKKSEDAKADERLPKPTVDDPAEAKDKTKRASSGQSSAVIDVLGLTRPFTNANLVNLLKRTGSFDEANDFWIDKIKSHAMVRFESADQAEETVVALDGVKWPPGNSKRLAVSFGTEEAFVRQSKEAVSLKSSTPASDNNKRRRSDDKVQRPGGRDESASKKPRTSDRKEAKADDQPKPKSLESMFNKTKTLPSIYWLPRKTATN